MAWKPTEKKEDLPEVGKISPVPNSLEWLVASPDITVFQSTSNEFTYMYVQSGFSLAGFY